MNGERWVSLAFVAVICAYALLLRPASVALYAVAYMVLPLGAIWYGDELGSFSSGWRLNLPTPGIMVKVAGWALLLTAPLAVCAIKARMELGF